MIIDAGRSLYVSMVIDIPAEFRLLQQMRIAHTADDCGTAFTHKPFGFITVHHLAELALYITHGFIDSAVIVNVRIISSGGTGHAVRRLMSDDINAL